MGKKVSRGADGRHRTARCGPKRPGQGKQKAPRKATAKHLENAALYYLGRFATSSENLKRVLMAKVERSAYFHDTDADEGAAVVEDLIRRYQASGLLDDGVFARARAQSLHRRGNSGHAIRAKLRQKGVGDRDIEEALGALSENKALAEMEAAGNYAKRRRFGSFAAKKSTPEQHQKQLAALARAGFSYDVARKTLEGKSKEK